MRSYLRGQCVSKSQCSFRQRQLWLYLHISVAYSFIGYKVGGNDVWAQENTEEHYAPDTMSHTLYHLILKIASGVKLYAGLYPQSTNAPHVAKTLQSSTMHRAERF